jgi:hypothetical protein
MAQGHRAGTLVDVGPVSFVPAVVVEEQSAPAPARIEILTPSGYPRVGGRGGRRGGAGSGAGGVGERMIPVPANVRVWPASGVTDIRKGMNGPSPWSMDPHGAIVRLPRLPR